jgi:hypothetical protein
MTDRKPKNYKPCPTLPVMYCVFDLNLLLKHVGDFMKMGHYNFDLNSVNLLVYINAIIIF